MGRRTSSIVAALGAVVALSGGAVPASAAAETHPFGPGHVCGLPQPLAVAGFVDPYEPAAAAHYGDPISPHGAAVYASATGFAPGSRVTITHTLTTSRVEQRRVRVGKRVVSRRVVKRVNRSVVLGHGTTDCWGQYSSHHLQPVKGASTGTLRIDGTTWRGTPFSAQSALVLR